MSFIEKFYVILLNSLKTLSHWLLRTFMWNSIFISYYRWNAEILNKPVQGHTTTQWTEIQSQLFPSEFCFLFLFLMPLSSFYLALWFLQMFGRIHSFLCQFMEKWPRIFLLICNIDRKHYSLTGNRMSLKSIWLFYKCLEILMILSLFGGVHLRKFLEAYFESLILSVNFKKCMENGMIVKGTER